MDLIVGIRMEIYRWLEQSHEIRRSALPVMCRNRPCSCRDEASRYSNGACSLDRGSIGVACEILSRHRTVNNLFSQPNRIVKNNLKK